MGKYKMWDNTGDLGSWNMWWYNYVQDAQARRRDPDGRPTVFMQFGGLGQRRVPHGFSGDCDSTWLQLAAEVNMTKTASNVLFAYWSHDIGGFFGDPSDELMVRWVQYGAVSPIL